jgi:hypothetical protein
LQEVAHGAYWYCSFRVWLLAWFFSEGTSAYHILFFRVCLWLLQVLLNQLVDFGKILLWSWCSWVSLEARSPLYFLTCYDKHYQKRKGHWDT